MIDFQTATHTQYLGKHGNKSIYVGNVNSDYCGFHGHPHGGSVTAIPLDAVLQILPTHRAVMLNVFFFKPAAFGPCLIELQELKSSERGHCVTQAVLKQLKTPAPLTDIEKYDPAQYYAKLHTIITTTSKSPGGHTYIEFDNQPSPPVFEEMTATPYNLMLHGEKVFKTYENMNREDKGEVCNAFEWPNGEVIDAKSLVCFADMSSMPKKFILNKNIVSLPKMSLQFEVTFRQPPTKPVKRVLSKIYMTDIIGSSHSGHVSMFDQDGYLLATAQQYVACSDFKKPNL